MFAKRLSSQSAVSCSGVARNFRQGMRQSVAFLSVHSRSAALPSRPYNQKRHDVSHRLKEPKNHAFS